MKFDAAPAAGAEFVRVRPPGAAADKSPGLGDEAYWLAIPDGGCRHFAAWPAGAFGVRARRERRRDRTSKPSSAVVASGVLATLPR